jgi:hypothetical protein
MTAYLIAPRKGTRAMVDARRAHPPGCTHTDHHTYRGSAIATPGYHSDNPSGVCIPARHIDYPRRGILLRRPLRGMRYAHDVYLRCVCTGGCCVPQRRRGKSAMLCISIPRMCRRHTQQFILYIFPGGDTSEITGGREAYPRRRIYSKPHSTPEGYTSYDRRRTGTPSGVHSHRPSYIPRVCYRNPRLSQRQPLRGMHTDRHIDYPSEGG